MNIEKAPPPDIRINTGTTRDLETVSELYLTNLPQDVISTTEDKLRLTLSEYLKKTERKKAWITPLGLSISLTLTLMTSTFKDLILSAATWKAIFVIAVIAALVWLIYSIVGAFQSVKIDDIIAELKKHSETMIKFVKKS
jgi:phosphoglycerol transferase MdoB-like AlkP superfamily enzyme